MFCLFSVRYFRTRTVGMKLQEVDRGRSSGHCCRRALGAWRPLHFLGEAGADIIRINI